MRRKKRNGKNRSRERGWGGREGKKERLLVTIINLVIPRGSNFSD